MSTLPGNTRPQSPKSEATVLEEEIFLRRSSFATSPGRVLFQVMSPDRTKEVGSEGNHIAAGIHCFGVGMSVDDCFVDGSECRHEGMFEAGLMEYLQFETGRVPGRMGRRHVAFGVIEDQSPARSAFVVLPETRGKAVDELQPRRRFVALLGLWVNCRSLGGIIGHWIQRDVFQTRTSVLRVLKTLVVKKGR